MSVTLLNPPPAFAFSRDQLKLSFRCDETMEVTGVRALNRLRFLTLPVVAGTSVVLEYGSESVTMTAAASPDDSGTQFPSGVSDIYKLVEYFQANYQLSTDFSIFKPIQGVDFLFFEARKAALGYDMVAKTGAIEILTTSAGRPPREKTNYGVLIRLYCENAANDAFEVIYEETVPVTYGTDGLAEVNISDKLHDYITSEIYNNPPEYPTGSSIYCRRSCRRYYFEYAECWGSPVQVKKLHRSAEFTVLHGGLSTVGQAFKDIRSMLAPGERTKDRFLKQGPLELSTKADQPQYLYFFNTRAQTSATLNCRFYFTDGTVAVITILTETLASARKYGWNITLNRLFVADDYPSKKVDKYELWLTDATAAVISESRFYLVDRELRQYHKYFLNWSSWGTMDTRMFYGKGSVEFELVQSEAERAGAAPSPGNLGSSLVYDTSIQTKFSITTGFIASKLLLLYNRDFFVSALKYVFASGSLLPIKVTSKNIDEFTDGNNLYAQKFDWQYLFDDHSYTEGDVFSPPVITPPAPGQVYFGSSPVRPTTAEQIQAMSSQSPAVYMFPMDTLANRIFFVATPPGKALATVYDQSNDENLTTMFVSSPMIIDGLTYQVSVMENAIPYTVSHTFIITIKNA